MPTIAEQIEWWTKQATHDVEIARSNRANNFHDGCALMCQQAAEKFLKSLFMMRHNVTPPKIHQCGQLATMLAAPPSVSSAARLLETSYMKSRYPDAARGVPFEQFSETESREHLEAVEEIQQWVLQELKPTA